MSLKDSAKNYIIISIISIIVTYSIPFLPIPGLIWFGWLISYPLIFASSILHILLSIKAYKEFNGTNDSQWWLIIALIPVVGAIIFYFNSNNESSPEPKKEKVKPEKKKGKPKEEKSVPKKEKNEALSILKNRYAKGEITKKEYEEIKKELV